MNESSMERRPVQPAYVILLEDSLGWATLARHENDKETHRPSEADAGCSLADSEANIRRSLRAARPIPEREHCGAVRHPVEQWCEERGLILPAHRQPERTGEGKSRGAGVVDCLTK